MGGDFRSNGNRRVNFLLFVVWSAFVVDRWLVVAWTVKSCFVLAEISSLMFLILFKDQAQGESRGGRDAVLIRGCATRQKN